MWLFQKLARNLTKVLDHSFQRFSFCRISNCVQVDCTLVTTIVKYVHGFFCWPPFLLETKNQVNPFMQMGRHILALQ